MMCACTIVSCIPRVSVQCANTAALLSLSATVPLSENLVPSYLTGDDDLRTQCGPPRFYTASLLELSKLDHLVTQRKLKTAGQQQNSMGFQRNTKKINMGLVIGKEKRSRAKRKPQISVRKISQAGSKSEPTIRVGASQDSPITLDSDDDAPVRTPLRQVR
ncbi:hypothetical protein IG631_13934 [Alternaria alternata]|nr:hypothetical protein IG631_13934 [Alternaria alternata]